MAKNSQKKKEQEKATEIEDNVEELSSTIKDQAAAATGIADQLEELKKQADGFKDAALRAAADADNTRKRAAKEVEEANKYGVASFAKDLISVIENLQRTTDAIPEEAKSDGLIQNLFDGVDLTKKELLSIFERRGIKRIEPEVGERFDHNYHQAMAQIEDPKFESGSVIQVMQAGYIIHDRLLRPAMVTVSKGSSNKPQVDTSA